MKSGRILFIIALAILILAAVPRSSHAQINQDVSKVKASDFSWFTGRWIGHMQNATAEQVCSTPDWRTALPVSRLCAG